MSAKQALMSLQNVSLTHGKREILKDISFDIHRGEIVSLIGPNGAGKTSLLRIILGLDAPTHGQVIKHSDFRCAYMPQKFEVNPHIPITAAEFLTLGFTNPRTDLQSKILKQLSLDRSLNTPLSQTSGGELQRLLLARALLKDPQLLILDEPTQGVDVHGQAELYEIIEEIRQELNCGILMVSHELHIVMAKTDSVICLNQHICCQGNPDIVSKDPAYIALFGQAHADTLAVYSHQHDHHHDAQGHLHTGECNHD